MNKKFYLAIRINFKIQIKILFKTRLFFMATNSYGTLQRKKK